MAKEINAGADCERIKLGHAVTRIKHGADCDWVTLHCANGASFRGRRVLCCLAPSLYARIGWEPSLGWSRRSIAQRMPMGHILKTNAYFKTAWWRRSGLNGMSFTVGADECDDPVVVTFDDSKPDGSFPSLMGFILSDAARRYTQMDVAERKACVLRQYARIFGSDKALSECVGYFEKAWHEEEWSGGCYVGTVGCNVMTAPYWKALKTPEGCKVHFAGTELADAWTGYMDGAIQSGEREAHKIVAVLAETDDAIELRHIFDAHQEPEAEDCALPRVDLGPSWIERHLLPNARTAKMILLLVAVCLVGVSVLVW